MGFWHRLMNLIDKSRVYAFLYFNLIFILLFILTYKGFSLDMDAIGWQRLGKVIVSTILFSVMFSILADKIKNYFLPMLCGCIYFLGTAGTFTLYTEKIVNAGRETHYELFFAEALVVILLASRKIINKNNFFLTLMEGCICALAFSEILYYFFFGVSVNADTLLILFQTNWLETLNFIGNNKLLFVTLIILVVSLFISIYFWNKKSFIVVSQKDKIIAFIILLVVCITNYHLVIGGGTLIFA